LKSKIPDWDFLLIENFSSIVVIYSLQDYAPPFQGGLLKARIMNKPNIQAGIPHCQSQFCDFSRGTKSKEFLVKYPLFTGLNVIFVCDKLVNQFINLLIFIEIN